jgi:hypothetical protein
LSSGPGNSRSNATIPEKRAVRGEPSKRNDCAVDSTIAAAPNLGVLRTLPGRAHELKGNRKDQISIDLKHPYRLIVEPADDPVPTRADGGLDWDAITAIRVLEVTDTHE